jgi:hypothetical protein
MKLKRGEQAKLVKELVSEHGFEPSIKMAISKLVNKDDYRIIHTPKGLIKLPETVKALLDSGFGSHSKKVKETLSAKKGKPAPKKQKTDNLKGGSKQIPFEPFSEDEDAFDIQDYIEDGKLKTTAPRKVVELWKAMQSADKDRIKNEKELKVLVNFDEIANKVFDFLRPLRDDLKEVAKRVSPIAFQAGSKLEAEKIINDELNRILLSRVGQEYNFDADLKKKIIQILTR